MTDLLNLLADETLLSFLQGDPQESSLFLVTLGPKLPAFVRAAAAWLLDNVVGDVQFARLLRASKAKSVVEMQEWQHRKCVASLDQVVRHELTEDPAGTNTSSALASLYVPHLQLWVDASD